MQGLQNVDRNSEAELTSQQLQGHGPARWRL